MASSFNQNGVCLVYIYRAFSLIYCAQLVFATLAHFADHA